MFVSYILYTFIVGTEIHIRHIHQQKAKIIKNEI